MTDRSDEQRPKPRWSLTERAGIALTLVHLLLSSGCTVWMIESAGDKVERMYALAFGGWYFLFALALPPVTLLVILCLRWADGR